MRSVPSLLAVIMLAAGLSGCFGGDEPLKAMFVATPGNEAKTQYKFDASASTGEGLTFSWDFGDRTPPAAGKVVEHTYQYPNGRYSVSLTVTDASKKASTMVEKIQVGTGSNNAPILYLRADKRLVTPDEPVTFDATQSYDADGDPLYFQWDFNSMLPDDELNKMENLGTQQYGRYANGPPPSAEDNGGENGATPSGHDWKDEHAKAVKRYLERAGITTLDGDHSAPPPEPRNEEFDGRINDTSPVQLQSFPSPATYFVHVRAYDVKGEFAEGFIRIRVADQVPNATDSKKYADRIYLPAAFGQAQQQEQARAYEFISHQFAYPGLVTVTLTFAEDPTDTPAEQRMSVSACTKIVTTTADCIAQGRSSAVGPSPRTLTFEIRADTAGAASNWQFLVANADNARTKATTVISIVNDLNPWAKQEAGLEVGHH